MSGHSKWATTKRAKAVVDAKRAVVFTRLAHGITLAAREKGGNPDTNFSLRLAIEKAREASMPKENIERAVKRGTGELSGESLEEITYEGFGPGGVALLVETLTNNRNRTVSEIKHILAKHGGSLGAANSVAWMFEKKGVIGIPANALSEETELSLIEAGAQDIQKEGDEVTIITEIENFQNVKSAVEKQGGRAAFAEFDYIPKNTVSLSGEDSEKLTALLEELEGHSDVLHHYSNRA